MEQHEPRRKKKPVMQEAVVDPAATNNLVGFFALLLEVDMRNNPQLYKTASSDTQDD